MHVLWYYTYLPDYTQYLVSRDRDLEPTELIWKDWKVDLKARQHSIPVISTLKREVCSNATVPRLMLASECLLWYSAFPMEAANFGVSRFQPSGADGCRMCYHRPSSSQRLLSHSMSFLPLSELTGCPAPSKRFIRLVVQRKETPISSFSTGTPAVALPYMKKCPSGRYHRHGSMDESTAMPHGPQDGWKPRIRSPGPCRSLDGSTGPPV